MLAYYRLAAIYVLQSNISKSLIQSGATIGEELLFAFECFLAAPDTSPCPLPSVASLLSV